VRCDRIVIQRARPRIRGRNASIPRFGGGGSLGGDRNPAGIETGGMNKRLGGLSGPSQRQNEDWNWAVGSVKLHIPERARGSHDC
jgi:hypothetical protein